MIKKCFFCCCFILAEEREELEVINNFRQKQLELQHRQLLQELEKLKTARETTSLSVSPTNPISKTSSNCGQDHVSINDSNFKHLM
jgi:hypothetical protein